MILVDTSLWIDHFRTDVPALAALLNDGRVTTQPHVIGELSLGLVSHRSVILREMQDLPVAVVAEDAEVIELIEGERLYGRGIGYIDAHLLASVRLTPEATLWTRDQRLHHKSDINREREHYRFRNGDRQHAGTFRDRFRWHWRELGLTA